jgi:hypothetical protein
MIISDRQVMQLIILCKDYSVILAQSSIIAAENQYNRIRDLLDSIAKQQSEELKVIE